MEIGSSPKHDVLYPVQISSTSTNGEYQRKRSLALDDEKLGKRRRSSLVAITIANAPSRRGSTMSEYLRNWRAISIEATLERRLAVEKLDSILRNVDMGVFDQVKRARTFNVKMCWLLLVFVMHVGLIYTIVQRSVHYYYEPVITTFALRAPKSLDFPRVYVCMAAAANRSFFQLHPVEYAMSNKFRERIINKRRKRSDQAETESPIDDTSVLISSEIARYSELHDALLDRRTRRGARSANIERPSYLHNESGREMVFDVYDFFTDAGFRVEETFLECRFYSSTDEKLSCEDIIEPILDINYGLCYSVGLNGRKQGTAGFGLTLLLNSHADLYPSEDYNAPRSSGVYVSVSNEYDATNWLKACAAPGEYTKIDITGTRVQLLNLATGSLIQPCIDERTGVDGMMRILNTSYTRTSCQLDCMLREFVAQCDCILIVDKRLLRKDVIDRIGFCTPNMSRSCLMPRVTKNTTAMRAIDRCRDKCYTPCDSWRYKMRTSAAPLNPPAFAHHLVDHLGPNGSTKNLIRLDISFPAIEYAELIQSASFTPTSFVSDIGGLTNLWMSASIVTLIGTICSVLGLILDKLSRCVR